MSGLIESATAILSASERRLEITAHNVANVSTPGFKRQQGFSRVLAARGGPSSLPEIATARDFSAGSLRETGNPLDLAITGPGFFQLRAGDRIVYSRQGQFRFSSDGTVVNAQGFALQQTGGGDLVLNRSQGLSVEQDGTVVADGVPIARLAVYASDSTASLEAVGDVHFAEPPVGMAEVTGSVVRQGMVENSNVDLGEEMVGMTAAVRQSETGARLVQTWDELIGRVITTLGTGR